MGQSLAHCSEQTISQPQVIPALRSDADVSIAAAQPAHGNAKCEAPPREEGVPLKELETLFDAYAGKDGKLGAPEIGKIWEKCAQNKSAEDLKEEEKWLINQSAGSYLQTIASNRVNRIGFYSFMLVGRERGSPLCQTQKLLQKDLEANPEVLQKAFSNFRAWDVDGDGYITREKLQMRMDTFFQTEGTDPPFDVDHVFQELDVDDDGRIDFWEFLAYNYLGRRKAPVELLLYDITQGNSKLFSSALLGKKFEAIYHSSILVHGKEFWYGGDIFMKEPPMSHVFGPTLEKSSEMNLQQSKYLPELKSVHLGYTFMTLDEIVEHQSQDMCAIFTKDKYHVSTWNCNHFSNHLAQVMCGNSIPEVITQQPKVVLDAPSVQALVSVLNKWLGGFQDDTHATVQPRWWLSSDSCAPERKESVNGANGIQLDVNDDQVDVASDGSATVSFDPALLNDGPVMVSFDPALLNCSLPSSEKQFAQALRAEQDSVDLKCFDPKTCTFFLLQAPSTHLKAIDLKLPLGSDSIQSMASNEEKGKKGWLRRFFRDQLPTIFEDEDVTFPKKPPYSRHSPTSGKLSRNAKGAKCERGASH